MIKRLKFLSTLCCLSLLLTGCSSSTDKEDKSIELNISAAASLKEAMADLEAAYTSKNPEISFVVNYGSSGSLQQQIEQGAPCDLFISAGEKQMTALDEEGLLLDGTNKDLVKRVIGVSGDTVKIKDSKVYVNGKELNEPYIHNEVTEGDIDTIVPENSVFVLGDNREISLDSRYEQVGFINESDILGKVFVRLYPFNKIGLLD